MADNKSKVLARAKSIQIGGKPVLPMVEEPRGQRGYVSSDPKVVTHFGLAEQQGLYGFTAHNYLAGKNFFSLKVGQFIKVQDEDGVEHIYSVTEIQKYQAVDPRSVRSDFVDLVDKKSYNPTELFKRVFTGQHRLILQTCIAKGKETEWGSMFIIAKPEKKRSARTPV